jgi:hypothetical protein
VPPRRASHRDESQTPHRPATTPEGRENQLVAAAFDLAEKQIRAGTASAQVISHFLKLGSSREKLEQEKYKAENKLLEAKVEAMAAQGRMEELYAEAIRAMGRYSGREPEHREEDYDE